MHYFTGYVGTYISSETPGTFRFRLNSETGTMDSRQLIYPQTNTKYTAWSNGLLATITESEGLAGVALLDTANGGPSLLDTQLTEHTTACFLTWHEGVLYSANYHDGHVLIYTVEDRRLHLAYRLFIGKESGCHQVIFHDQWMLVPCLCLDQIQIFDRRNHFQAAGTLQFPQGTGPRHGVFTRDHRRFYLVSETTNELFYYRVNGLSFTLEATLSLLPPDFTGKGDTAAIRLSEDEQTLYISIRGADDIAVFHIGNGCPVPLQHTPSLGREPWDLLLVPGGRFLLAANRKSDEISCFSLHADGTIDRRCGTLPVPQCVGMSLAY